MLCYRGNPEKELRNCIVIERADRWVCMLARRTGQKISKVCDDLYQNVNLEDVGRRKYISYCALSHFLAGVASIEGVRLFLTIKSAVP